MSRIAGSSVDVLTGTIDLTIVSSLWTCHARLVPGCAGIVNEPSPAVSTGDPPPSETLRLPAPEGAQLPAATLTSRRGSVSRQTRPPIRVWPSTPPSPSPASVLGPPVPPPPPPPPTG